MNVTFRLPDGTEKTVVTNGKRPLLEVGEDAGLDLPYSCRSGACSDCTGRLVQGKVDQSDGSFLSDEDMAKGFCLTCIAIPQGDCTVHTHQRDELS